MTASNEPRVSDEDRQAAIKIASQAMLRTRSQRFWPDAAVNALIADGGWGPKPTVTREALIDHVSRLEVVSAPVINGAVTILAESMADALVPFLRECGIEVTDQ